MTQKYSQFIRALSALCEEHEVRLDIPEYAQHMDVLDLQPGDEPLSEEWMNDFTTEPGA